MHLFQKILIILGVTLIFIGIGSAILFGVLTYYEIPLEAIANGEELNLSNSQLTGLKIGFGLNHLVSFVFSGIVLLYIFKKEPSSEYLGLNRGFDWRIFLKFVGLLLLMYPVMSSLLYLIQQLPLPEWANSMDESNIEVLKKLLGMDSLGDYLLNFLVIAVFAGVGEELIFRGILQKELYNHTHAFNAIMISAFVFGIMHMEAMGLIVKILIGVALGFAYYITKNILYPVLLHTLNNGLQVTILYVSQSLDIPDTSVEDVDIKTALIGLVFVPAVYLLGKHIYENHLIDGEEA